jgi:hypothetical protein
MAAVWFWRIVHAKFIPDFGLAISKVGWFPAAGLV